jgi:predicted MFS family arabinose efflux permease
MWRTARHPGILAIGAFIFLWNFNPFTSSVLYMHMVDRMGFSEEFYGTTSSIMAVGCMLASAAYGVYCRRLSVRQLMYLSIVTGVLATISYWGLRGMWSAGVISFVVGFTYMTGMLVQLDLGARVCEIETAGTTFALLMALANLAVSAATYVGGQLYEAIAGTDNYTAAFNTVVAAGAMTTCFCVFLVPTIRKHCQPYAADQNGRS